MKIKEILERLSYAAPNQMRLKDESDWEMIGENGDYEVRFRYGGKELIAQCPDRQIAEFIAQTPLIIKQLLEKNNVISS